MAEEFFNPTNDGQEAQLEDLGLVSLNASRADDRMFAELLRMTPFSGTIAKVILPYATATGIAGTVQPSGSADSKVVVYPFRAIMGSTDTIGNIGADNNWRDIRSGLFIVSDDGATIGHKVTFGANVSGNSRWDLVYAAFSKDVAGPSYTRYDKPANGGAITTISTSNIVQSISIAVQAGAPGAVPTQPATPTDSGGIYYFPLAYVRIPTGFGATNTIDRRDIFEVIPVAGRGVAASATADGANTVGGSVNLTTNFKWTGTGNQRPAVYLPPSMKVEPPLIFEMDLGSTVFNNSHGNGGTPTLNIIDSSRDWRKRFFKVHVACVATGGPGFAQDRASAATAANRIPVGGAAINAYFWQISQSFTADAAAVAPHSIDAASSIVAHLTSAQLAPMLGGSLLVIFVDGTTGALRCDFDTTGPQAKFFFWIEATTPMSDY